MSYDTIFDIAQAGYRDWWWPLLALLAVAVSAYGVRHPTTEFFRIRAPQGQERFHAILALIFWIVWTLGMFAGTYAPYRTALAAYRDGRTTIVEGTIDRLRARPAQRPFSFSVDGREFEQYVQQGYGYSRLGQLGEPLRIGMRARVTHVDGVIVKLEIVRPPRRGVTSSTAAPSQSRAR